MVALMPVETVRAAVCDAAGPSLVQRKLLSASQALELSRTFKLLSSETRLRMLHALERAGELSVAELAETIEMSPQAVSNQLQRLVDRQILAARRVGNSIFYRIVDPCLPTLLELGLCLTEESKI